VVVYAHIYAAARSAASLILPTPVLGKKYYSINFWQTKGTSDSKSQFNIVAVEDNTTIRYQKRQDGLLNPAIVTTVLSFAGDVLQVQDDKDLTGSIIESIAGANGECKRIAVFSGSSALSIGNNSGAGTSVDPLYQQCYPVTTWGKNFGIVPFANNPNGYHLRVLASENNTAVTVNGATVNLNEGEHYPPTTATPIPYTGPSVISSNKPVTVAQYLTSTNKSGSPVTNQGDPDMVIINPVEQNINDISIFSSSLEVIKARFLSVYMKTAQAPSFRINNALPAGSFVTVPANPAYSYLVENLTPYPTTFFRLKADSGFNATAYGLGDFESYAYSAGANVKDQYQVATFENQFASVNFPAACKGSPFFVYQTFTFQPTQITFEFKRPSVFAPPVTLTNPVFESTQIINGRTIYRYKLPTPVTINTPGTYFVDITATNPSPDGCNGLQEIELELTVFENPTAAFAFINNGCLTDEVKFTDKTNTADRKITNMYWDFVENEDFTKDPGHTFPAPGSYKVRHAVVTDVGCLSDTIEQLVNLTDVPAANFSTTGPYCIGKEILFSNTSTLSGGYGSITKWIWNFGDGKPDVVTDKGLVAQKNTYNRTGSFDITLSVESSTGCKSVLHTDQIIIGNVPKAGFISPEICLSDPFAPFTDTSKLTGGSITGWSWNFGDPNATGGNPNTSTDPSPSHKYTVRDTYTATLLVTSDRGCTNEVSQTFTINGSTPRAAAVVQNENSLCSNKEVVISNTSEVDLGTVVKLEIYWDYTNDPLNKTTDDEPQPGKLYNHLYPASGKQQIYDIRIVAYSGITCLNTFTKIITVKASPSLQFAPIPPVCEEVPVFQITPAVETTGIAGTGSYSGPGISVNGLFTPRIAGPGLHTIRYTFSSTNGCDTFKEQSVMVYPSPTANAGTDKTLLEGGITILNGNATGSGTLTYLWTPNRTIDNIRIPAPTVHPIDDIIYTLTITSGDGCKDDDEVDIKVLKTPIIPNIFSPNGDRVNDRWDIPYLASYPGAVVEVFNRYGQIVFRSVNYTSPWDGTFKGNPLPIGTYYYIIQPKNGRKQISGYVAIVR
jgi:gliding motility-associated-like protein